MNSKKITLSLIATSILAHQVNAADIALSKGWNLKYLYNQTVNKNPKYLNTEPKDAIEMLWAYDYLDDEKWYCHSEKRDCSNPFRTIPTSKPVWIYSSSNALIKGDSNPLKIVNQKRAIALKNGWNFIRPLSQSDINSTDSHINNLKYYLTESLEIGEENQTIDIKIYTYDTNNLSWKISDNGFHITGETLESISLDDGLWIKVANLKSETLTDALSSFVTTNATPVEDIESTLIQDLYDAISTHISEKALITPTGIIQQQTAYKNFPNLSPKEKLLFEESLSSVATFIRSKDANITTEKILQDMAKQMSAAYTTTTKSIFKREGQSIFYKSFLEGLFANYPNIDINYAEPLSSIVSKIDTLPTDIASKDAIEGLKSGIALVNTILTNNTPEVAQKALAVINPTEVITTLISETEKSDNEIIASFNTPENIEFLVGQYDAIESNLVSLGISKDKITSEVISQVVTNPDIDKSTLSSLTGVSAENLQEFSYSNIVSEEAGNINILDPYVPESAPESTPETAPESTEESTPESTEATSYAPVLSDTTISIYELVALDSTIATLVATDPDSSGSALTYTITSGNDANRFALDSTTGVLKVVGALNDYGAPQQYTLTIKVDDGSLSDTATLTINITDMNDNTPIISGTPAPTIAENAPYSFTPSSSDADGETLIFSIANKPSWALFDKTTGKLSGTPSFEDSGTYGDIAISASDGWNSATLPPFSIDVTNLNRAPIATFESFTNSGSPYSGILTGSDADGDSLTFSKISDPAHGTLEIASGGSFTYTPAGGYEGSDSFSYSVNDGVATSSNKTVTIADSSSAYVVDEQTLFAILKSTPLSTLEDTPLTIESSALLDIGLCFDITCPLLISDIISVDGGSVDTTRTADGNITTITFTPDANFNGDAAINYAIRDTSKVGWMEATATISVQAVNDAPISNADVVLKVAETLYNPIPLVSVTTSGGDSVTGSNTSGYGVDDNDFFVWPFHDADNMALLDSQGDHKDVLVFDFNNAISAFSFSANDVELVDVFPVPDETIRENPSKLVPKVSYQFCASSLCFTSPTTIAVQEQNEIRVPLYLTSMYITRVILQAEKEIAHNVIGEGGYSYDDYRYDTGVKIANVEGTHNGSYTFAFAIPVSELLGNDSDVDGDTLSFSLIPGSTSGVYASTTTITLDQTGEYVLITPSSGTFNFANFFGSFIPFALSFQYKISDGNGGESTSLVALHIEKEHTIDMVQGYSGTTIVQGSTHDDSFTIPYGNVFVDGKEGSDRVYIKDTEGLDWSKFKNIEVLEVATDKDQNITMTWSDFNSSTDYMNILTIKAGSKEATISDGILSNSGFTVQPDSGKDGYLLLETTMSGHTIKLYLEDTFENSVNTLPVISAITFSPTTVQEGGTLSAEITANDFDGDTITYSYAWKVNGKAVSGQTGATLDSAYFGRDDKITLTVVPFDSKEHGAALTSQEFTIANTAPQINTISLVPATVYDDEVLRTYVEGSDIDGDTITYSYAWSVNGSVVPGQTGEMLEGTFFSAGDSITVTATPNDGTSTGAAKTSAEVIVASSAGGKINRAPFVNADRIIKLTDTIPVTRTLVPNPVTNTYFVPKTDGYGRWWVDDQSKYYFLGIETFSYDDDDENGFDSRGQRGDYLGFKFDAPVHSFSFGVEGLDTVGGLTSRVRLDFTLNGKYVDKSNHGYFYSMSINNTVTAPHSSKFDGVYMSIEKFESDNSDTSVVITNPFGPHSYTYETINALTIPLDALLANDSDIDGDSLSFEIVPGSLEGNATSATLDASGENIVFALASSLDEIVGDIPGAITFRYKLSDGNGGESETVATVDIVKGNSANSGSNIVSGSSENDYIDSDGETYVDAGGGTDTLTLSDTTNFDFAKIHGVENLVIADTKNQEVTLSKAELFGMANLYDALEIKVGSNTIYIAGDSSSNTMTINTNGSNIATTQNAKYVDEKSYTLYSVTSNGFEIKVYIEQ